MASTKFLAILPQKVQAGDRIRIKGKIATDAEEFSINFANETCKGPQNITYHFKWLLYENIIVEAYKDNNMWMDHRESEYNRFDGRFTNTKTLTNTITNGFSSTNVANTNNDSYSSSILGPAFALEFAFQDDGIYVYLVEDGGHNLITQYEPMFEMSDIESVQIWGDVEKINELTFAYK